MRPIWIPSLLGLALLAAAMGVPFLFQDTAAAKKPQRQVLIESSAWELSGPVKGSLRKVGKIAGTADLQLFFGPLDLLDDSEQVVVTLETGHFLIQDLSSGATLQGQYFDNGKGKLTLSPQIDELRSTVASTFESAFDDLNLEITELVLSKVTVTAKAKARSEGDSIKLKLSTRFLAAGTLNNEPGEAKGRFSFSVQGVPVIVEPAQPALE